MLIAKPVWGPNPERITNAKLNQMVDYAESLMDGSGVPDGGEEYQVLTKISDTDGEAEWRAASQSIPAKYRLQYVGSGPFALMGNAGAGNITPGDSEALLKSAFATSTGKTNTDVSLAITTNTAPSGGTGLISTGGVASASHTAPGDSTVYPDRAFDGDTEALYSCWWSNVIPSSLKYDLGDGNGKAATGYKVWPRSGNYGGSPVPYTQLAPRSWTFEGSVDGSTNWVVLDTRTGITGWADNTPKTFSFSNSTIYRAYRLVVTLAKDDGNVMIGELQITGLTTPGQIDLIATIEGGINHPLTVSAGSIERTQDGNQEGRGMAYDSGVELRAQVEGLQLGTGSSAPRAVTQTGHGFSVGNPIRALDEDEETYAIVTPIDTSTENELRSVGVVVSVADDDHFSYQPIGPIVTVGGGFPPLVPGNEFYFYQGGGGNLRPTTPGVYYLPLLRPITPTEGILLAQTVEQVPIVDQITTAGNYAILGFEDRIDLDTTSGSITATLPANLAALYRMPRITIYNQGPNDATVACYSGTQFSNGTTSVTLGAGNSLETYVTRRSNGTTYQWAKV